MNRPNMKPGKAYILGPMTGYPDDNRAAFRKARKELQELGWTVVCPEELDTTQPLTNPTWSDYMRRDIPLLMGVQVGFALPGWKKSRGATLEATILNALGVPVADFATGLMYEPGTLPAPKHPTEVPVAIYQ